ncbi:hypothetical protein [Aquimarina sediminis]|uniref:hypothetical protein n=1 Tax=Aquimarina sediminis TaxID=2070536 RepID=UPI000CA01D5F|nr:hypothetical protein [Aquimarina sediminis]
MKKVLVVFSTFLIFLSCIKDQKRATQNVNQSESLSKLSNKRQNFKNSDSRNLNNDLSTQNNKNVTFFIGRNKFSPKKVISQLDMPKASFNQNIVIVDTIEEVYFYNIKSYLIQCENFEKPIWSGFLSSFKFPESLSDKTLTCTDESLDPFDCLFEYFVSSLQWDRGTDLLEHREYDEETFSFKKGFRLNKNQVSFWSSIQLLKQTYNLPNTIEENFYHNESVKIWTSYDKQSSIFFRIIEENEILQIVLDDYSYKTFKEYNMDSKTISDIINDNKFSETNWVDKITMNNTWDFILSTN